MAPHSEQPQSQSQPKAPAILAAAYDASDTTHDFEHALPPLPGIGATADKTAYLGTLRVSLVKLQAEVNTFLTQRMEEDSRMAATAAATEGSGGLDSSLGAAAAKGIDDKLEEENYGEEVVDEDA